MATRQPFLQNRLIEIVEAFPGKGVAEIAELYSQLYTDTTANLHNKLYKLVREKRLTRRKMKVAVNGNTAFAYFLGEVKGMKTVEVKPPTEAIVVDQPELEPEPEKPKNKKEDGRVYLEVPFSAKDDAKYRGARWDAKARKWFVPPGVPIYPFLEWTEGYVRTEPVPLVALYDDGNIAVREGDRLKRLTEDQAHFLRDWATKLKG